MLRTLRAAVAALLFALSLVAAPSVSHAAGVQPPVFAHFGGPTAGFVVLIPRGWTYRLQGSAATGARLELAGPPGSGLTAEVSRRPAGADQPLGSLLPTHYRILRQTTAHQWWGTGIGVALLRDRGAVAAAVQGTGDQLGGLPRYQQHGVLRYRDYLYHLSVSMANDSLQGRAAAGQIYSVMLGSLTPAVYPVPLTPQATVLRYWSAIGHHDVVAAYDLLSHSIRLEMAAAGTDAPTFAHDAGHVRAMQVLAAVDITPKGARAGHREYQVTLRMKVHTPSPYHDGINVRFVTVMRSPATQFTIGRIASAPIPARGI